MRLAKQIFSLPSCLLILLIETPWPASSEELQWPYNLPKTMKYYPEDEIHIKRDMEISQRLQQQAPIGVRKMSTDPGEKFFLDYWSFEGDDHSSNLAQWTNSSLIRDIEPCLPLHTDDDDGLHLIPRIVRFPFAGGSIFDKRAFTCPTNTYACTSISRPNSCCAAGSTCQIIQDTGLGDVGCCPNGETCGGTLTTCAPGYTSCPSDTGGGCCVPGYGCFSVGCVLTSTAVVVVTPTPASTPISYYYTTVTSTVIIPYSPTESTSTIVIVPTSSSTSSSTSIKSTTTESPVKPLTSTVYTTITISKTSIVHTTPTTCASGFQSCAASTGGGCCPNGQLCGTSGLCPDRTTSSTVHIIPPVRPTTSATSTRSSSTSTSTPLAVCPTGFYACSAYYRGGCCQTGRNCDTTSCPATASTSLITGSVATIVAPTGSGITTQPLLTGTCVTGWFSCAVAQGGGCCPNGFACGSSCTATTSGVQQSVVGKSPPTSAASAANCGDLKWMVMTIFSVVLFAMV